MVIVCLDLVTSEHISHPQETGWYFEQGGAMPRNSHADSCAALAEMRDVLIETYAVNDAMNQLLLANLNPKAWHAELPGARVAAGQSLQSTCTFTIAGSSG